MNAVLEAPTEQWVECKIDSDYEINIEYPYEIRRKNGKGIISRGLNPTGYPQCNLNGRTHPLHRIIATQFIPNDDPDNKNQVDHINHDRADFHIENLRWVSRSENLRNTSGYAGKAFTFVDEIDDNCIVVDRYGSRTIENLYYDPNLDQFFLKIMDNRYRIIEVRTNKAGYQQISVHDVNNKVFVISIRKFKEIYNIDC